MIDVVLGIFLLIVLVCWVMLVMPIVFRLRELIGIGIAKITHYIMKKLNNKHK